MGLKEIQEAIFKSIDSILEKRLSSMKFNYCIEGIIVNSDIDDSGDKFYVVNYQDMKIKAYPQLNSAEYLSGEVVYILVINGDISKKRLILSKV